MNTTRPTEPQIPLDEAVVPAPALTTTSQTRSARLVSERRSSESLFNDSKKSAPLRWEDFVKPDEHD